MEILIDLDAEKLTDIQIPLDPLEPGGPFSPGKAVIVMQKGHTGVACIDALDEGVVDWLEQFDHVYFQMQHDGKTLKVLRKATDEDIRRYRVPIWIQSEDVPECCGQPMVFVGQIDDNALFTERPPVAKMWWHNAASFYVFTCSQCLEVKAVGQQF